MKKIIIKKTLAYDPTFENKYSRFQGYSNITMQRLSPSILSETSVPIIKEHLSSPIFSSSLNRGYETAKLISKRYSIQGVQKLAILNEVFFDLEKLVTEEEFNFKGSTVVREKFIQSFIDDTLAETRNSIHNRIIILIHTLSLLPNGTYLLISHSFLMKIFEIYRMHPKLFLDPTILRRSFDTQKKTYEFGEGFTFNL